ncbi:hypothetical protein DVH05_003828 [Phytophthora capsici]|nr:hypothetical protein DVH05_003828 [Phytophthora capsici]
MEDDAMSDVVMEDAALVAQENRVRVNRVRCIIVGTAGQSFCINIESNATVENLKGAIKSRCRQRLKDVEADDLLIFLAKKADGAWLSADGVFKDVKRRMVTGEVPDEIVDIISDGHKLLSEENTIAETLGSTFLPPKYLHLLVKPPLPKWTINHTESSAVAKYKGIAELVKESKEVKAVVKTLKDVRKREDPMPFVVLENSSGTGKTQMAFNLEAQGDFDVFYLLCTSSEDAIQTVYQAFESRQIAFEDCITSDIAQMKGEGSVGDFGKVGDKTRLKVYAFIIAALRGAKTFMGDAFLKDVKAARGQRKKPIVFFLDEFPRPGKDSARKKLVRSMRNVFRFLRLPLIISATNGKARNLFTVSDYSRTLSEYPVSWCMVIPSLPKFVAANFAAKRSATLEWIIWIFEHSRPLFGALAQEHMERFRYDGQDPLEYLTDMVKALTPKFRRTKRGNDFEKGQLYLFLAASYNVVVASRDTGVENKNGEKLDDENDEGDVPEDNDGAESKGPSEDTPALGIEGMNWGISDDESDGDDHEEDDVSEDDDGDDDYDEESKEYPDEEMPEANPDEEMPEAKSGSDENSSKEVNLIDGHYGRMEEEETFELQLEGRDLIKNDKEWGCRCVFPRLEDDILLFLTLRGDYEGTTAPLGSAHRHQPPPSSNKRSPLDRPFWKKLRGVLDQNGTTTRNTSCRGRCYSGQSPRRVLWSQVRDILWQAAV